MRNKKKQQAYKKAKLQAKIAKLKAKILTFESFNLGQQCFDVQFQQGMKIANELKQVIISVRGAIVISAPQIGYNKNIVVIRPIVSDEKRCIILINPKIKDLSKQENIQIQGCISFPGYSKNVKRESFVTVEYTNQENEKVQKCFACWEARCVKIGIDILNGKSQVRQAYLSNKKNEKIGKQDNTFKKVTYQLQSKGGSNNGYK